MNTIGNTTEEAGKAPQKVTSLDLYRAAFDLEMELTEREGITDDELDARLNEVLGSTVDKLDGHRYHIDHFINRADMLRSEVKRLQERARMLEGTAEHIKRHALMVMEARVKLVGPKEGRKVETEHGIVYLRKSHKVRIFDDKSFIETANRHENAGLVEWVPKIDKREVMNRLKQGDPLWDEAVIEETVSVIFK